MRERLEGALVASTLAPADENLLYILDRPKRLPTDMRTRLTDVLTGEEHNERFAAHFDDLDAPRPLPGDMRARLMSRLLGRGDAARLWQIGGAAAAAVLVLVATVFFTTTRGDRVPGGGTAITPIPTVANTFPPSTPPTNGEQATPSVRPTATTPGTQPTRRTQVLGIRETRRPNPAAPAATAAPVAQPTGGITPIFGARTSAPSAASPAPTPTDLVGSVVNLVRNLLSALNLDVLSVGHPTGGEFGAEFGAEVPAAPAAPAPVAPKPRAARSATVKQPAATTPKASTSKPAEPPKPLIEIPLNSDDPILVVDVPVVELTISL